jgi:hypothetical protein
MTITRRRIGVNFKLFCIKQFEKTHNNSRTAKENGVTRATLTNVTGSKTKSFYKTLGINVKNLFVFVFFCICDLF